MRLLQKYRRYRHHREERDRVLEALYRALKIELYMYVSTRVKPSDIEDVLQEVWKAIVKGIRSFRGDTDKQFLKWCYVIAMRKAADSHSRGDRMELLPDDEMTDLIEKSSEAEPMSPEDRIDLKYAMDLLRKAKPQCLDLLWKYYVLGLDISDLAEELQLKYDATRARIKRCLDTAQGLL